MPGSFSYSGESEDDIGMSVSTIEDYIGHNPVPVYLGQEYTDKLRLQITLVKNPNIFKDALYFSEKDCRNILRIFTGLKHYQWMKLIAQNPDEDLYYRAILSSILYKRIGQRIAGIILNLDCDSCFAWSKENTITLNVKENQHFYIYNNTDDLGNYIYPYVSIHSSFAAESLTITNMSDNWNCEIKNVKANELITIDSKHQIIASNIAHENILNDFNLGWIRLIPDKNVYVSNSDISITMKFRVPRKVGIIE